MDILAKLNGLTADVDQLLRSFRLLNQNLTEEGSRGHETEIVTNLETCVRSAGKLVSSASTLVTSRSQNGSQFGSEFGSEFGDQERSRIEDWIPEATIFDATEAQNLGDRPMQPAPAARSFIPATKKSVALPQVRTMSKNTEMTIQNSIRGIDYDLMDSLLTSAENKFRNKAYAGAEEILQRMLVRANVTYSSRWKWRGQILRMLAVCYCQLERWEEAAQVLDQGFNGREQEMATVATDFCLHDRLDAAKNLLKRDFQGRDKIMEFYAKKAYWRRRWGNAEEALLKLLHSTEPEGELEAFRYMQALAEVKLAKGDLEIARDLCLKAMYGRKNTLGKTHVVYYQSVNLLALICEAQNDQVEAEAYKALLPTEFKGTSLLIDQE
jgi:hypothetical protein